MSKNKTELKMKVNIYNKLMMWGFSQHEFLAVLGHKNNCVVEAIKIPNRSKYPRNIFVYSNKDYSQARGRLTNKGYKIMTCHSHPAPTHKLLPSRLDWAGSCLGSIEVIVLPIINEVRAWVIQDKYRSTVESSVRIKIVD